MNNLSLVFGFSLFVLSYSKNEVLLHKYIEKIINGNYHVNVAPRKNPDAVFKVGIALYPTSLMSLKSQYQKMSLSGHVVLEWTDELIEWNPADFNNVAEIYFERHKVWTPTLSVVNGIGNHQWVPSSPVDTDAARVILHRSHNDTKVAWYVKEVFLTTCSMNIKYFPNDIQFCNISICMLEGIYADRRRSFKFELQTNNTGSLALYKNHGEWHLVNSWQSISTQYKRTVYTYSFEYHRNHKFYLVNFILPLCFFSMVSIMVYLLPPKIEIRLNIGVTILLSYSVFMLILEKLLPKSQHIANINKFLTSSMTLTIISIFGSIVCLRITGTYNCVPLPKLIDRIFSMLPVRRAPKEEPEIGWVRLAGILSFGFLALLTVMFCLFFCLYILPIYSE